MTNNALYADGTEILLGDKVEIRKWFKNHSAKVIYVPGISQKNKKFEYNGLQEVVFLLENKDVIACFLHPETKRLVDKKIIFIHRDQDIKYDVKSIPDDSYPSL